MDDIPALDMCAWVCGGIEVKGLVNVYIYSTYTYTCMHAVCGIAYKM